MKKIAAVFFVLSLFSSLGVRAVFADDAMIASQLDAIEKKQDKILTDLEALKSELQIIKIRVSSR